MDRTILHCDANGFFASVECLYRPELKDVPMAVSGSVEDRHGIILAKNELAKGFGIRRRTRSARQGRNARSLYWCRRIMTDTRSIQV